MYLNRDMGISNIKARKGRNCYGMGLGIILLDDNFPGFPGDVRNPSAFPFPIQYEIAEGVDINALIYEEDKSLCLKPLQRAAKKLEKMGCRAIAAECGYFAYFQKEIAVHVKLPVFMSSLLQTPWAQQLIGPNQVVGLFLSEKASFQPRHFESAGIIPGTNYVAGGIEEYGVCGEFDKLWTDGVRSDLPEANYERAEKEFINVARKFYQDYPDMGAMVLECTGFQPFARALQREIDIPIFSWGTLLDFAYSIVVHRDYYGHV